MSVSYHGHLNETRHFLNQTLPRMEGFMLFITPMFINKVEDQLDATITIY